MNAEGFKGKAVRGCATLKAGVRVTTVNDEDSERPARTSGVVKIHVVQGRRLRIGYTLTDERSFAEAELLNAARGPAIAPVSGLDRGRRLQGLRHLPIRARWKIRRHEPIGDATIGGHGYAIAQTNSRYDNEPIR
jgi:hypothetical protein